MSVDRAVIEHYQSEYQAFVERQESLGLGGDSLQQAKGALALLDVLLTRYDKPEVNESKVDTRKFNSSLAVFVREAYRVYRHEPFLAKDVIESHVGINRDATQAKHWGLIEELPTRSGNGRTDGRWRVTEQGAQFARGHLPVPSYRISRRGVLLRLEGPLMTLEESLGQYFNYEDHMELQGRA